MQFAIVFPIFQLIINEPRSFSLPKSNLCESFLRNALFTGRLSALPAVTWSRKHEFRLIRPLIYVSEELTTRIAESLGGLYSAVLNKYWIDEIYAAVIVGPMVAFSRTVLWQGVDRKIIDETLDDAAAGANQLSGEVRKMQSGNIRSYAAWVTAGAVVVIGYMMWMGAAR